MKKNQYTAVDTALREYGEKQGQLASASRSLWSMIIPLITETVAGELAKLPTNKQKFGVPREMVTSAAFEKMSNFYHLGGAKVLRPSGRKLDDGLIILMVDSMFSPTEAQYRKTIIEQALDWAYACEYLAVTPNQKHKGPCYVLTELAKAEMKSA